MRTRSIIAAAVLALALAAGALAASLPGNDTARDRTAWRAILHWSNSCESGWKSTGTPGSGIDLMAAGARGKLVAVQCFPGAYQGDQIVYLVKSAQQKIGPFTFRVYSDPGNGRPRLIKATVILGVLDYNAATGTLTVFDKFAGIGDCGIYSTYRLQQDQFVLTEARAKTACDGKGPFSPQRWPKLPIPK